MSYELVRVKQSKLTHSSLLIAHELMKKELIELRVNGRTHEVAIEPSALAARRFAAGIAAHRLEARLRRFFLRRLHCAGRRRGDDVVHAAGGQLRRPGDHDIEGVSEHGSLAAIQKAYGDWGGAQCGYCTPGLHHDREIVCWRRIRIPREEEIRDALSSNLCRCTGYNQMYQAIRSAVAAEKAALASSK